MSTAIEFNHVGKQYRLGTVSTGTLSHDLNRWFTTTILRKEDPYLKIGSVNDRTSAADSEYVWALKDIDFKIEQGDVVGIIGKNGAGKSTLLKLLSRVTGPTVGTINARGRIGSLLEVGTGFHPEQTGRENIYINGAILGMTKAEIKSKLDEIVAFSGCERYIDTPVKRYSSGMQVRLGFAVAAFLEPEILVVDEVLAVGDAEFQKKAIGKMQDVAGNGRTVLFVSHNMASVRQLCNNGVFLENGQVKYLGDINSTINLYLNNALENDHYDTFSDMPRGCSTSNKIQFEDIKYLDANNEPKMPNSGGFLRIQLGIIVREDVSSANVAIGIRNSMGVSMINLPTNVWFNGIKLTKGKHTLNCDIDRLPLTGGCYRLGLWAEVGEDCADYIDNIVTLNVEDDDFFQTGKLVSSSLSGKVVLCEHKWSIC